MLHTTIIATSDLTFRHHHYNIISKSLDSTLTCNYMNPMSSLTNANQRDILNSNILPETKNFIT